MYETPYVLFLDLRQVGGFFMSLDLAILFSISVADGRVGLESFSFCLFGEIFV